jgi:3-deoxy-7-phosphoheptulonate synthase
MLIILKHNAKEPEISLLRNILNENSLDFREVNFNKERMFILFSSHGNSLEEKIGGLSAVKKVMNIKQPFKLSSREFKQENSRIIIGNVVIGGVEPVIISGPCSVESEKQIWEIAAEVASKGADILRGGVYKPRTSPYSFQGLGVEAAKWLCSAGKHYKLPVISEVMEIHDIAELYEYVDIFQVGARNMQNFKLLKELGRIDKPVLLKRGNSATLNEFLMSAEYILCEGNEKVILCERGIRTFVEYTRNTFDLNIIPTVKELSHLPIIIDASHATGKCELVNPVTLAGLTAGADGFIVEVHPRPKEALSDGEQSLNFLQFSQLIEDWKLLREPVLAIRNKKNKRKSGSLMRHV